MMVRNLFPGGNQTPTQFCRKVAFSEKCPLVGFALGVGCAFFPTFPNIFPTKYGFGTVYVFLGYPPPPPQKKKKTQQNPTLCWKNVGFRVRFFCVLLRSPILWCTRLCTGLGKVALNSENPAALIVSPDPNRTPTPRFCTQKKTRKKTIRTEISIRQD